MEGLKRRDKHDLKDGKVVVKREKRRRDEASEHVER